ncbi:MAG: nucleoside phosphorylase [Actinomycetota bacterium]
MSGDLPITGIPREGLPKLALVTGDPDRISFIAKMLDGSREVASRREYVSCVGSWKGVELVVCSHGVGAPGAILAFHELATAGVGTFVRAGTCGGLVESIADGDLVIATSAVRRDGVTDQMVDETFPAVSDAGVVSALERAASRSGHPWHRGIVLTQAMFFPGVLDDRIAAYAQEGAIAVEMELSALLVLASMKGLRAGGVLTSDGNPMTSSGPESYDPHRIVVQEGIRAMFNVALDALHDLADAS